jgi:hypothetical protein
MWNLGSISILFHGRNPMGGRWVRRRRRRDRLWEHQEIVQDKVTNP